MSWKSILHPHYNTMPHPSSSSMRLEPPLRFLCEILFIIHLLCWIFVIYDVAKHEAEKQNTNTTPAHYGSHQ